MRDQFFSQKVLHLFPALCAMACMQRAEDKLQEYVLSFHHVGSRHSTQAIRFGSKDAYLLSHLGRHGTIFSSTSISSQVVAS